MGVELEEVDKLRKDLIRIAKEDYPKECKSFLRAEGTKLRRIVIRTAKRRISGSGWVKSGAKWTKDKQPKEKLVNSYKRGKVYKFKPEDALAVRVYNAAPHAHQVEEGHIILTHKRTQPKNGKKTAKALHILKDSEKDYAPKFEKNTDKFLSKIVEGLNK